MASSWPMRCACHGSRCARSYRCIARSGRTGPIPWASSSAFSVWPPPRWRSGCTLRRSPRRDTAAICWTLRTPSLQAAARRRFIDRAARSLAAAAGSAPQLSTAVALDRCRTRMLDRLDALRRDPRRPGGAALRHAPFFLASSRQFRVARSGCHGAFAAYVPLSRSGEQRPAGAHPAQRQRGARCRLQHRRPGRSLSTPQSARTAARYRQGSRGRRAGGAAARPGRGGRRRARSDAVRAGSPDRLHRVRRRAGAPARSVAGAAPPRGGAERRWHHADLRAEHAALELRRPAAARHLEIRAGRSAG